MACLEVRRSFTPRAENRPHRQPVRVHRQAFSWSAMLPGRPRPVLRSPRTPRLPLNRPAFDKTPPNTDESPL